MGSSVASGRGHGKTIARAPRNPPLPRLICGICPVCVTSLRNSCCVTLEVRLGSLLLFYFLLCFSSSLTCSSQLQVSRRLQFARHEKDDHNDEKQPARTIIVTATRKTAAAEGEDQENDQDETESADSECATSEFHGSSSQNHVAVSIPSRAWPRGAIAGCDPGDLFGLRNILFALPFFATMFNHMVKCSPRALNRTFAALADPTRRRILEHLAQGDHCVTDLARPHRMSLAAVSKHLGVLERAGLIRRRRHGRVHQLKLEAKPMQNAQQWIEEYRHFWEANLDRLDSYLTKIQTKEKKE